jgi:hypothetical protein
VTGEIPAESSTSADSFDCSAEGLKYVAGYLAHNLRTKFPQFGEKTGAISFDRTVQAPWIHALSRGGLTVPSENFLGIVKSFDCIFKEIHGNSLNTQHEVMGTTIKMISCRFPHVATEVIKKFVRTRTFIRITHLNKQLIAEKEKKRNKKKLDHFTT